MKSNASAIGMLEIAEACGLNTVGEAYENYMNHYDCFFSIENFKAEFKTFKEELTRLKLDTPPEPISKALSRIRDKK